MTEQQNFGGMGDLLKKLTENPEMLSKAMSMASALASSGALSGFTNSNTQDNTPKKECDREPPPPPKAECPPPGTKCKPEERDRYRERIALLEAMRPFISAEKKDRLELLIRLLGVMELADGMGSHKNRLL